MGLMEETTVDCKSAYEFSCIVDSTENRPMIVPFSRKSVDFNKSTIDVFTLNRNSLLH